MNITLAESAGFCFGVSRAVKMVEDLLKQGETVATLGPIIHNPQIVERFRKRGVSIIESPDEAEAGSVVVIRSHGVSAQIYEQLLQKGVRIADATCPFVSKIHRIVAEATRDGRTVLIAGDRNHPEVEGICGHCRKTPQGEDSFIVFRDAQEFSSLAELCPEITKKPVTVVAQTTFSMDEWKNSKKILKKVYTNALSFDTICNATALRQSQASELSRRCDLMIVVGGKHSSNTAKLCEVCRENCETYLVETADELPMEALQRAANVGVTAGASTPADIIKEVLETMSNDVINNTAEAAQDSNFAELLEESLKSFNTDEKVHGVVVGITPTEVYVDVGRKQAGFIPAEELSNDPAAKPEDLVKLGDEMDLLIMRTNDQEGTIMLSKKRYDAIRGWETIAAAAESKEVLTGTVAEVVKGGLIVVTEGVRVFVPASQATASRNDSLDEMLKKEVKLRIIEVNRQRGRRAVGSIRSVLRDERRAVTEKFWEEIEEGKEYVGTVKSLTQYGAFVDLGGVDGMIHISELSWVRIKHPSEVVNVGDTVSVFVKSFDKEKGKISLGFKRQEDNPWEIMKRDYPVGTVCEATVVGMTTFGAFARILPGIDGLIHISQIANRRIEKPQDVLTIGEVVNVKVTDVDFEKKRVSLSIRALLSDEAPAEEAPVSETPAEEVPAEEAPSEEVPAETAE
ncbi:MAG: bifunctional 4-hydroxy-3-methylbut-2-enyl diphosphate reductase/30S ribosomal protein S1 [Clostridia bacterium]|nr:bifunctional 4-hydroxy-3-methylbut-2-enyl diphosphate reductase/30S ribosomal protein S1 [Clostridia bacterium]